MTVETPVSFIDDLNASYPADSDYILEGAEHIRNIKTAIKATFPNVDAAVNATDTQLNLLVGATYALSGLNSLTATAAELNTLDGVAATLTAAELNILDGVTATTAEINYLDGVTSAIQTQLDGKLGSAGGTMSGTLECANNYVDEPVLRDYSEAEATPSSSSGTLTLDLSTANVFKVTASENITTITISNAPASGNYGFKLLLNIGTYSVSWPTANWPGGSSVTPTASGWDLFFFEYIGGAWYASRVAADLS